jgi:hypothetical protein
MIPTATPSAMQSPAHNMGDPKYTAAARRFFGQAYISKAMGPTPALNPVAGARHFAYNWGADSAFSGRHVSGMRGPVDSFTMNHVKDFSLLTTGVNNIADYRTAGKPSAAWGLYQRDPAIMRGPQATDVGENNYVLAARPTATGRDMSFYGTDVTAMKMADNMRKYKEVQAKLAGM